MNNASYICNTQDNIVLILSHYWTPVGITTAKEGIRKLISHSYATNPQVKAISSNFQPLTWNEWIDPKFSCYHSNQPFLRAAKELYPVPTILLTTSRWVYKCKDRPSIQYLYQRFKGQCQICGESFPIKKMSVEHILPKSRHGSDHGFNLTITCKTCNSRKSSMYPVNDYKDRELKAPKPYQFFHTFLKERKEWLPFLFKKEIKS